MNKLSSNIDLLTLTATLAAIVLIFIIARRYIRRWNYHLPPGPVGLPLLGNIVGLNQESFLHHRDKYGDVSYVNAAGTDIVLLNSIEAVREALQGDTAELFNARPFLYITNVFMYEDVLFRSPTDSHWKQQRQIFHSLLRAYGEGKVELERVVKQELNVVIDMLRESTDNEFNMNDVLEPSLLNILNILMVGERYDYNHWRITNTRVLLKQSSKLSSFFYDTLMKTFPFLYYLPFSVGKMFQNIGAFSNRNVAYMLERGRRHKETGTGIIFEMLRLQDQQPWITESIIVGTLQDITSAGYLTTRSTLRTFFLLLLRYPQVQSKIQAEIDENIDHDVYPTLDDRGNMPYTQAAVLELTRYSSVLFVSVPHACIADTTFHGYTIPRGSIILPNLFRIHHDTQLWKDPWKFDPTRFLDDSGNLVAPNHPRRHNLVPFGVGKRMCLGEVFAKTRTFLYITFLLQRFTIEPSGHVPSCDPREFESELVLSPPDYKLVIRNRHV